MAQGKIQLDVTSTAHLDGLVKANKELEAFKLQGQSVNRILKDATSIDAFKAAIERAYHSVGLAGKTTQGLTAAMNVYKKTITEIQQRLGADEKLQFTIIDEKGVQKSTRNIQEIMTYLWGSFDDIRREHENLLKGMTRDQQAYSFDAFTRSLERGGEAIRNFGSDAEALEYQITRIKEQGRAMMLQGLKEDSDEVVKLKAHLEELQARLQEIKSPTGSFDFESFMGGLDKDTKWLQMFGSELEVINAKIAMVRSQGKRLIEAGGTEEEIAKLKAAYDSLIAKQKELQTSANGTGTRIKNLIKNFVSAQLIVYALRRAFSMLTTGLKEASQAAAEAEQVVQKFMTVFEGMGSATRSVEELATQFGLARTSAMEIMATIGDMAVGLGATDAEASEFADTTSKFIQDLMAFKDIGGDVVEISKAFMSGVAGNTRNFRQWGSIVKESTVLANLHAKGLDKLTGQELEWAKAQERTRIVMEQQKNAMGATQREWDHLVTVNRRYNEQTKQMKESIGEAVNKFFLPMKSAILEQIELWNDAYIARKEYMTGVYNPMAPEEFAGSQRELTARTQAAQWYNAKVETSKHMRGVSLQDATTVDYDALLEYAKGWGATAHDAARVLEEAGYTMAESAIKGMERFDKLVAAAKAKQDRLEGIKAYAQAMSQTVESLSGLTGVAPLKGVIDVEDAESIEIARAAGVQHLKGMTQGLAGRGAEDFMSPLDLAIGADVGVGLREKQNKIKAAYEALYNTMLKAKDAGDKDFANEVEGMLDPLVGEYLKVTDELEKLSQKPFLGFDQQNKSLKEQLDLQRMRTNLLAEYGEENSDIINILVQQKEAVAATYTLKQQAIDAGWAEVDAENARLDIQKQILEIYQEQRAERERLKSIEDSEAIQSAIEAAGASIAEVKKERSLVGATDAQRLQAEINEKVWLFAATLTEGNATLATTLQMTNEYRRELEMLAADEAAQAQIDAAKEINKSVKEKFLAQTDYDLVKDIMDAFKSGGIWGGIFAIIGELIQYMETFGEILHALSNFFAYIGPWLDQVVKPLMPVLEALFSNLADLIVPVLIIVFPIIKFVAVVLLELMAIVKTVTNVISWMGDSISTFVYNLAHPFKKKAYRDLGDETAKIWSDMTDKVNEIWDLEIDTRHDYVSKLTEAQNAEIKAYEEMYKSGLLSLEEKERMIGKNIFGRNWDKVEIQSFAKGGDFLTNGEQIIRVGEAGRERVTVTPVNETYTRQTRGGDVNNTSYTVVVNGADADPEAIAVAVRKEFRLMERRGERYA